MRRFYQLGGSLAADAPSYVLRKADRDFCDALIAGEFCYVFNSRQMGKSSLKNHTKQELEAQGIDCIDIDLMGIGGKGKDLTAHKWYRSFMEILANDCLDNFSFSSWWHEHEHLTLINRLDCFIEQVLLKEQIKPLVIFIDEIDTVKSLNFDIDDFFALLKSWYDRRAQKPKFYRLTFALLGVATPTDLIQDKATAPFNIGRAIELTGFSFDEAKVSLIGGLENQFDNPESVLKNILKWTGGQPFLTQKLCYLLTQKAQSQSPDLDEFVYNQIIENWEAQDNPQHLRTILNRLLSNEKRLGRILGLYQQILVQKTIEADSSFEQDELLLSGLIIRRGAKLETSNPIYQAVFNQSWVNKELQKIRPYAEAIAAWEFSNYQDKSRLLRGNALADAQAWAKDKTLSHTDYKFLTASEEQEQREVERKLAVQKEANQILKEAKQKADRRIQKANSTILIMSFLLVYFMGFSILIIQQKDQFLVQKETKLDSQTTRYQFQNEGQLDALLSAIQTGYKGQLPQFYSDESLTTTLHSNLEEMLDNIQEQNQLNFKNEVKNISFSPNVQDKLLAVILADGSILLHNWQGQPIKHLTQKVNDNLKGAKAQYFSFSPDGKQLVIATEDGKIFLWEWQNNHWQSFKQIPKSILVRSISFLDEQLCISEKHTPKLLITAALSSLKDLNTFTVKGWDLQGNEIISLNLQGGVNDISFGCSIDGNDTKPVLATALNDHTVKLWNQENPIRVFRGHASPVNSVNFSPDRKLLVSASSDNTIRLWDWQGNQIKQFIGHQQAVNDISFSPDGTLLASASRDGTVKLWNLRDNPVVDSLTSFIFSPDGQQLAAVSSDGNLYWWNFSHNSLLEKNISYFWDLTARADKHLKKLNLPFQKPIYVLSLSNNKKWLVTTSSDNQVQLWNLQGKIPTLEKVEKHEGNVWSANFSHNSKYLVTASSDGKVKLWDLDKKEKLISDLGYPPPVNHVRFSPDGKYLAIALGNGIVTFKNWPEKTQLIPKELKEKRSPIYKVSFSEDGKQLATASRDGYVRVWDLQKNSRQIFPPQSSTPKSPVFNVELSKDGKFLATVSNNQIQVWNLSQKPLLKPQYQFNQSQGQIYDILFNSKTRLSIASTDGSIKVWQIKDTEVNRLNQVLEQGCDWLQNYLMTHPDKLKNLEVCKK